MSCPSSPDGKHRHVDRVCRWCGHVKFHGHKCSKGGPGDGRRRSWHWNDGLKRVSRSLADVPDYVQPRIDRVFEDLEKP